MKTYPINLETLIQMNQMTTWQKFAIDLLSNNHPEAREIKTKGEAHRFISEHADEYYEMCTMMELSHDLYFGLND